MSLNRPMLIAGNWKMNGLLSEGQALVRSISTSPLADHVEISISPPFTLLHALKEQAATKGFSLGAQDVYLQEAGAYTGEISPAMLVDTGCKYIILGHSERRHIIGESNEAIQAKLKLVWQHGLEPILCIGEKIEERENGTTNNVLVEQLAVLKNAPKDAALTIAYEPVWAIGTGLTATPEQVSETHAFVHQTLQSMEMDCRVLYGGSVNPGNAESLMGCEGVEGALVGGASLKADLFNQIISSAAVVKG
ncbi:MAG: triose-phosphate isomerase [Mariprofundaceae bacterium]|nr:triose-phosphate isomerase [Mariprofundaceae bacterium]